MAMHSKKLEGPDQPWAIPLLCKGGGTDAILTNEVVIYYKLRVFILKSKLLCDR